MSLEEVFVGEKAERIGRIQGLRGQKGPQTLSLVKDKSHHGDPGAARGAGGKPGECGVHRPVVSRGREGPAVSEAAERSR